MCVSVEMLFRGSSIMWSPVRELCKCVAKIQPLSFTQLSARLWHGHQMCRVLAAIHKHDLLVIPVSSLLLVFVSCGLWCARSSVYVWETAAKGPPISVFHSFSSSSLWLPGSFMLLCMNPTMFQTASWLRSALTFLWHFSSTAGTPNSAISCQETRFSN